jgi:putative Flp pilus-assembly TadE/G-like protein
MRRSDGSAQRGQVLALFALALTAIVLGAAVVVDGGYAFVKRRAAQNAADFAAMAGTRVVGVSLIGRPAGAGTASNVEAAIDSVLAANGAELVSARYVDEEGDAMRNVVGAAGIPDGAFGVVVEARTEWRPFLLGILGVSDWATTSTATAFTTGRSVGGGVLPLGIRDETFDALTACPVTALDDCIDQNLTSGHLNIPGGFGWLKFGLQGNGGKCDWESSLGMIPYSGCETSQTFLDSQIGPPSYSHGCCTAVGLPGSEDKIGSLTGNEWGDLSFYIDNQIPVWVPIWDEDHSEGSNGYYGIAGFGAIVFTGENEHAKWLKGAAIANACTAGTAIEGHAFCSAPGAAFSIDATGEVRLVR